MNKTVIGVGQVGTRLARQFAEGKDVLLTFNTDERDSKGIKLGNDKLITSGGAGKSYSNGLKIWAQNHDKLERYLEPVENQDIVYFVAAGGGSGSSSVLTFLNILLKQNNKILLVISTPFIKESIPATTNATRLLSRVNEFTNDISVLVVSNDEIAKSIKDDAFYAINNEISNRVRIITDLIDYHNHDYFTPFAIDNSDHRSVAYSGGFINISLTNLEENYEEKNGIIPKFSYGTIKDATNILVTKAIPTTLNEEKAMKEGDKLIKVSHKIARSAKYARVLHGTIRTNKDFPPYITMATGMDVNKIFDKLKNNATKSAMMHTEKINEKKKKILERSEDKVLDI
jgi:cell division GTPase FtsZ